MRTALLRSLAFSLLLLNACAFISAGAHAQTLKNTDVNQSDEKQLLRDLLMEMRQLRIVLQRGNLNVYRAQIILERVKIQQARVDRIMRQLEESQNEISGIKLSQIQLIGQIKDLEDQIKLGSESDQRTQQQIEHKELKRALEQQTQRETLLNEQRENLTSQLLVEQTKLESLNEDLAEIEKDLRQSILKIDNKKDEKRP